MIFKSLKYKNNGFTLIEMLLGLAIFSVIVLCLYSVLSGGIRLSRFSEKNGNVYREARWVLLSMADELERMVPYDFERSYTDRSSFAGSKDQITFILPAKDGLKVISYYLGTPDWGTVSGTRIGQTYSKNVNVTIKNETSERVNYLFRKERDLRDYLSGDPDDKAAIEIMSTNIKKDGLRFSFGYIESEENQVQSWRDSWTKNYIPSNVQVEVDFLADEEKQSVLSLKRLILIPSGFWGLDK